jgi:cellobiose-specific phosphotransferase system component IIA
MTEADELRRRAESLLAMAIKAREQGQFDNADSLIAEASKFLNDADALEAQQSAHPEKKE